MNEPVPSFASYVMALPEIILVVGAMVLLMLGAFRGKDASELINWLSIVVIGLAAAFIVMLPATGEVAFEGAFIVDPFARFMKIMTLIASAAILFMSSGYLRHARLEKFEYPVLILLATTGMMMMISANDLIALYLGVELQSLALYVLAAFRTDSVRSSEAGLKYFVLGALSSGMLLYGCSLIYGFTGSTGFSGIASAIDGTNPNLGLVFGLVFFLAGLAFKVSAVPFHMWTPDVYEGAPTPVTAFFASAPKVAAMAMFVRVVLSAFPDMTDQWQQIIVFIS
ncbi:MAG: NADH-quinone oxidoreductase subunit N, partial [Proteobacteria bacterium]|nr:NADH-quinone oxidoreductase subunit N [Pseudomonadota bacterium]